MDKNEEQAIYDLIEQSKDRVMKAAKEESEAIGEVISLLCKLRDKARREIRKTFNYERLNALERLAMELSDLIYDKDAVIDFFYKYEIQHVREIKDEEIDDEDRKKREYFFDQITETMQELDNKPLINPWERVIEQMKKEEEDAKNGHASMSPWARIAEQMKKEDENKETNNN